MFNTASALLGPGHCVQMFIQACWLLADNTLQHPQEEKVAQNRCTAARFHSVSFSKPNPVWFGKVTPENWAQFSKPIPIWFGKKKIDFARRIFQSKSRLVWKILMTIVNVLKIPNQIQFGLEKSLTIANALNLEPIPVLFWKSHFRKGKHSNIQVQD